MRLERQLVPLLALLADREQAHLGLSIPSISSAKTAPIVANWRRCSGRASAFAPASMRTDGPCADGIGTAIAGRITPGSGAARTARRRASAPVFPAETTASARPSATARTAATSEQSGFARTASAGFSSSRRRPRVTKSSRPRASRPGVAEEDRSTPSPRASSAPATISSGPCRPPSRRPRCGPSATERRCGAVDVAALVRAAGRADVMRPLRLPAVRADVHARRARSHAARGACRGGLSRFSASGPP